MLVRTTLVRALYFSALLATACPQLWKATRAMGTRTFQLMSSPPPLGPNVTSVAAMTMRRTWKENEAQRTHRRLGEKYRWKRLNKKDPTQKHAREVPDLIHLVDSLGAASPSPM